MGVKLEEVTGGEDKKGKLWIEMAEQIYCENGKDEFRILGHFSSGAPFLKDSDQRISISHCDGMLVVATLAETPDAEFSHFSPETALGVDAERADRKQVVKLRERFLCEEELKLISADSVEANIIAWTAKEALYKAALMEGLDFRKQIIIDKLPVAADISEWLQAYFTGRKSEINTDYGHARVIFPDGNEVEFNLYSYLSEGRIITVAFTLESKRFKG